MKRIVILLLLVFQVCFCINASFIDSFHCTNKYSLLNYQFAEQYCDCEARIGEKYGPDMHKFNSCMERVRSTVEENLLKEEQHKAQKLFNEEKYEEAIKFLEKKDTKDLSQNDHYLLALSYEKVGNFEEAESSLEKIIDMTDNKVVLEKAIYKLKAIKEEVNKQKEWDRISKDLIPYSEIVKTNWDRRFKKQYLEVLGLFEKGDFKKAEEKVYALQYDFNKDYKLLYNIAHISYKADILRQAKRLLGEIYQNTSERYREQNYELIERADELYKKIEAEEKHQEEQKAQKKAEDERKKQEEEKIKSELKKQAELAKVALGEKRAMIEGMVAVIKSKDAETQHKIHLILDTFKLSQDEYTKHIGFYLSYLLE